MEEDLQKRNTDCVYFLASPLTCKKGLDCEYRHSEIARVNPRDCWYWLAANCLNPTCAFRHPPLEAHAEAPSESAQLPYQCSVPNNKTSFPCYFYFNGFCNKGDKCSFSHGSDGSAPSGKSSKTASATTDALSSEKKTSAGNDTRLVPTETHLSPSETAPTEAVNMVFQPKENLQPPAPKIVRQRSASPQMSVPECKDLAVVKSESLLPAEGFIQRSHLCMDQSSDEQVDDHIELEERWESSPGFDVLVDNKSENLGYEDDPDYLLALDREHGELHSHFLGYDFKDPVEYDPTYPDAELLYEREIYDSYDLLDNKLIFNEVTKIPGHSRERMLDSILSQKRKLLPAELADDREGVDLRDHLRKRRVIDGHPITRLSGRHDSPRLIGRSQERPRWHGMARRLHGRLASEGLRGRLASQVGKNTIESLGDNETLSNGASQHGWRRQSQSNGSRQHYKEKRLTKRQFLSSEISKKKLFSREKRRSNQASSTFTGPKTLAQIKEEKNKAEENGNYFGKTTSADFQGPKPLSEILKDKGRLASARDDNTSSS